jgi:hypothetical protein
MNEIERYRVDEIRRLHTDLENGFQEIVGQIRLTVDSAIRIGELLRVQKDSLNHGEWLPWIKKHLPFDARTAQRYMRAFENRVLLKNDSVSHLSEAYHLLEAPLKTERERQLEKCREMYRETLEFFQEETDFLDTDPSDQDMESYGLTHWFDNPERFGITPTQQLVENMRFLGAIRSAETDPVEITPEFVAHAKDAYYRFKDQTQKMFEIVRTTVEETRRNYDAVTAAIEEEQRIRMGDSGN